MSNATVAVVGAGPSGLVAAKHMLEFGLTPTIFEKSSGIGGMWNPECHPSWKSLRTNLSRFTNCFSDFPWPQDDLMFPTQSQMYNYLLGYCKQYIPNDFIQFNTTVNNIKYFDGEASKKKWQVQWSNIQGDQISYFDFIIIATGFFSNNYTPSIPMDKFKGHILHSSQYRSPDEFKGKRVLVIGASFSSTEISAELSNEAESVINLISKPFWTIPRYIPLQLDNPATPFVPLDFVFYNRSDRESFEENIFNTPQRCILSNQRFNKICGYNGSANFQPSGSELPFVAISDDYVTAVRTGKIVTKLGRVAAVHESSLILQDGSKIENVEAIIFSTGFHPTFPFFDEDILEKINFDPNDCFNPLLLYKSTFCPELPSVAFIGMYRGPYFLIMELQSIWAAKIFSGELKIASESVQHEGILIEKEIKDQNPRPQFPHPDYVGFAYSIAEQIGILPTTEWEKHHPIVTPFDFRSENKFSQLSLANLKEEYQRFLSGKMVSGAIFHSLQGKWTFQPSIKLSDISTAIFKGSVIFSLESSSNDQQWNYLSSKMEFFVGPVPSATEINLIRRCKYNHSLDSLYVSFEEDKNDTFHTLRILPPSLWELTPLEVRNLPGWKAVVERSTSKLYIVFEFSGVRLKRIDILSVGVGSSDDHTYLTSYLPTF